MSRAAALAALALVLAACDRLEDAATAIAYDIESQSAPFEDSGFESMVVVSTQRDHRNGCKDGYKVQFSAASALVVWCKAPGSDDVVSSHTTTYHLNFVEVPETFIVEKGPGESVSIEIDKVRKGKYRVRLVR